ncbi:MAG: SH3 domain-containing protein [Gemmatimonadales bacterium]
MGRLPALVALFLVAIQAALPAQNRLRATGAANFLKEPGGIRLATLVRGVEYAVGRTNSGFTETTIEGWIFAASTEATTRDGFDLTVIAGGGENLRATPGGAVVARLQEGTLLSKVSTSGNWIRVRRSGWVPRGNLGAPEPQAVAANPPPPPPPAAAPGSQATQPAPASPPVSPPATPRADSGTTRPVPTQDAPPVGNVSDRATLKDGAALSLTPDGQPVLTATTGPDVEIVDRARDWVKVRVEGWVRTADVAAETSAQPRVTAAMLREAPDRFVGQTVEWKVQFLAVREADALRPEIPKGQQYVLARGPLPETGFVYIMVTKEQANRFLERAPLDEVRIEGIIRAGRLRYLPTPVVELTKVGQ